MSSSSRAEAARSGAPRWDDADQATQSGTYGDCLLSKFSKVFPDLGRAHTQARPQRPTAGRAPRQDASC